jgi:hypothetical protein
MSIGAGQNHGPTRTAATDHADFYFGSPDFYLTG